MDKARLWIIAAAAILITPAIAREQIAQSEGSQRQKQKAWIPANFRVGLDACSLSRTPDGFAVSGTGAINFDEDASIDLVIGESNNGEPSVTAHAINTKGTGAQNHRTMEGQACTLAPSPRGTIPAGAAVAEQTATCAVSGDPDTPLLTFEIPLSAFGAAKSIVGHVTLIKREPGTTPVTHFLSKKGYDYYQAKSEMAAPTGASSDIEMEVIASCDTSGLTAKAKQPMRASYDLALGKKA